VLRSLFFLFHLYSQKIYFIRLHSNVLKDCSVSPSPCWKPKPIAVAVAGKREWQVPEVSRSFEIETASLKTDGLHVIMGDHFVAGGEFFCFSSTWHDICRVMMVQLLRKLLKPRVSQRSNPVRGTITSRMFSTVGVHRIMYCVDRATGSIDLRENRLVRTILRGYVCTHVDTHRAFGGTLPWVFVGVFESHWCEFVCL